MRHLAEIIVVLMGLERKTVLKRLSDIIEFSELSDFIDQPIRTYFSGMLARLGFSVIAHLDPQILLIGEIPAVGDAEFRKKCPDKMARFKERGVTIVFVSHARESVETICDRVLWVENKTERMMGPARTVCPKCSGMAT